MSYIFRNKDNFGKEVVDKLIRPNFFKKHFANYSGHNFEISEVVIVNHNLRIKINEKKSAQFFEVVISAEKGNKYFLNFDNQLFFYYQLSGECPEFFEMHAVNLLKFFYKNLVTNALLSVKAIALINDYSLAAFGQDDNGVFRGKYIDDFKKKLNLNMIRGVWPNIKSFDVLAEGSINTIKTVVIDSNKNTFFLKICFLSDDYLEQYLEIYKILEKEINVPNIVNTERVFLDNGAVSHWLLYQYIEPEIIDKKAPLSNRYIKFLATELYKLHNIPVLSKIQKASLDSWYHNSITSYIKSHGQNLLEKDKQLSASMDDFLQIVEKDRGLCHGDLHLNQFIAADNKIYLVDFEMLNYGYLIFDLASLVRDMLAMRQSSSIGLFLTSYYQQKFKNKYSKHLLLTAIILFNYYQYLKGNMDQTQLDRSINEAEKFLDKFSIYG